MQTDPRVDAYIAKSADFAQPILHHFRALVHKAVPGVTETMKWSFPHFVIGNVTVCSIAAFKAHVAIGFSNPSAMKDEHGLFEEGKERTAMGQLGRLTSKNDLPKDAILKLYLKEAALLIETGVRRKAPARLTKADIDTPADLLQALKGNALAQRTYDGFSPSHKREYIRWIEEAKRAETRTRRIQQAMEWMSEGKSKEWRYQK